MSAHVCGCDHDARPIPHHCNDYPNCAYGRTLLNPGAVVVTSDDALDPRLKALLIAVGEDNPAALALIEAWKLTHGDRKESYGRVQASFAHYAKIMSGLLGHKLHEDLTASDVALIMIALKLAREAFAQKSDNVIDTFGYTILLAEIKGA